MLFLEGSSACNNHDDVIPVVLLAAECNTDVSRCYYRSSIVIHEGMGSCTDYCFPDYCRKTCKKTSDIITLIPLFKLTKRWY